MHCAPHIWQVSVRAGARRRSWSGSSGARKLTPRTSEAGGASQRDRPGRRGAGNGLELVGRTKAKIKDLELIQATPRQGLKPFTDLRAQLDTAAQAETFIAGASAAPNMRGKTYAARSAPGSSMAWWCRTRC